ncbi:MAG: TolC family protein [Butyricicoccus sp.]|nr:TolC family protein [Butyricicoccus sp.]
MKRAAAAGLCAALLCGMCAPAYAADTAKPAQTTTTAQTEVKAPVKLSFDTLEKTVREGNVSIRSYQQTVESAEKTDVSDQYVNKYFNLSQQIDAYDKQISSLKKSRDSIEDTDLRKTITAQISVLQATRDSLYQQYKDLDDDEDDAKDEQKKTVDSTRRQMQNNADTICLSAENNYISLASMQYSLAQTERSLQQLDRSIAQTKKQVALGIATKNTLSGLESQRELLAAQQKSAQTSADSLANTLAIQCGYPTGTEITIESLPEVTAEQLASIDYETDLAEALKNSYSIWSADDSVRKASDDYENDVTNNLHAYEAAKIQRDATEESVKSSFRKLYKTMQEKNTAMTAAQTDLAQAQKTFAVSQLQYNRGMISRIKFEEAQDTYTTAQETAENARTGLLTAYNNYQWAKRGVMTSAS